MSYEGEVVLNYRLGKQLGEGGFGVVYLAEHAELGRKVACKILHREFATKAEVVERFFREARSVCAIGHRAIIDIENFGHLPGGEPYYLMEYFPGEALSARAERGPLAPAALITIFDAIASALAAAHAKQIIHRDLKPENIMVLEDGEQITDVKLLDFGIAKLIGEADDGRSRSGMSLGTPAFMAPEQAIDSKSVDARADIYAFAATVFAAIAGCAPFSGGGGVAGVLLRVQTEPPIRLRDRVPTAPTALEQALEHGLAKLPGRRPATIGEMWSEIRAALATAGPFTRVEAADGSGVAPTLAPDAATGMPPASASAAPLAPAPATVALRKAATPPAAASGASAGKAATTLGGSAGEASLASLVPAHARSRLPLAIGALVVLAGAVIAIVVATRSGASPVATAAPPVVADAAAPLVPDAAPPDAAPPDAAPPDAVPPDAAPRHDAGVHVLHKPDPIRKPDPTPVKPDPTPVKPDPTPVKPDPAAGCTVASFAAIYLQASPSEADVRAALGRLNGCRAQLSPERFKQLQQNLVSKL